jgi:hypothetical protein
MQPQAVRLLRSNDGHSSRWRHQYDLLANFPHDLSNKNDRRVKQQSALLDIIPGRTTDRRGLMARSVCIQAGNKSRAEQLRTGISPTI